MIDDAPQGDSFPYAERSAAVEAARQAVHTAFSAVTRRDDPDDPATAAWEAALVRFEAAVDAAYPPGFETIYERLREGNAAALVDAIEFLEADPWFFRSGYIKAKLVRLIKRWPLTPVQADRLRAVVVRVVDGRDRREFRDYCRLARRLDGPELRAALERRLTHPEEGVRRRAGWALAALGAGDKAGSQ
jgi:hypothetical protein